jgi:hypothetical protein
VGNRWIATLEPIASGGSESNDTPFAAISPRAGRPEVETGGSTVGQRRHGGQKRAMTADSEAAEDGVAEEHELHGDAGRGRLLPVGVQQVVPPLPPGSLKEGPSSVGSAVHAQRS